MGKNNSLLEVCKLNKVFTSGIISTTSIEAVNNVCFHLKKGEILSLVGESGSGKSTVANIILRLLHPTSGNVYLDGKDILSYQKREYYKRVQPVFQDPYGSFNLFYRVDRVLKSAFNLVDEKLSKEAQEEVINKALAQVGLNADEVLGRYPHQLSGGQLQRFLLARILIIRPELVIADEPTSMIDASSRAGILNILEDLRDDEGLSVLFITHDIGQAQYISERVVIMKAGEVAEQGSCEKVLTNPEHPYSKELLANVPSLYAKWDFLE